MSRSTRIRIQANAGGTTTIGSRAPIPFDEEGIAVVDAEEIRILEGHFPKQVEVLDEQPEAETGEPDETPETDEESEAPEATEEAGKESEEAREAEEPQSLEDMTNNELLAIAEARGIEVSRKSNKAQIIAAISAAE